MRIQSLAFLLVLMQFSLCFVRAEATDKIDFNQQIRPILSDRCFSCHGPDAETREADLRLDLQESALGVISPGKPQMSDLVERITSDDPDLQMPPAEFAKPLDQKQIDLLVQWVKEGANWEEHWSLSRLDRPEVPKTKQNKGAGHPIDAFISRGLTKQGLSFSESAKPHTLLRRLSFDLTGLPPNFKKVQEFTSDHSDEAYSKYVDELLNSPQYGERMAIYWLDLVRYADTLGYHGDQVRSVSPYRDYVIQAFNNNKPFDQFTIEQLAGDLMPDATIEQKIASTYNRLNRASAEGGVQPKEYLAKYSADRVRTTGAVWLGSTFGCAECHDHKFDPFTTKDFYSFAAFFADIKELGIVSGAKHIELLQVPTTAQSDQRNTLNSQQQLAQQKYDAQTPELTQAFSDWQEQIRNSKETWNLLTPELVTADQGTTLTIVDDGSVLASGKNPVKETYRVTYRLPETGDSDQLPLTAFRLEVVPDPSLPAQGPGRAGNGNFVINAVEIKHADQNVEWASSTGSHSQGGFLAEFLGQGNKKGWAILPHIGKNQHVTLFPKKPVVITKTAETKAKTVSLAIVQTHGTEHNLGKFRLYVTTEEKLSDLYLYPKPAIRLIIQTDISKRTPEQVAELQTYFRKHTPQLAAARKEIAGIQSSQKKLEASIVTTLATKAGTPREMRILPRGDWMSLDGEVVEPAVPHYLPQPEIKDRKLNRLDLANWMVDRSNPLVARSFVNRLWMLFYGNGLSHSVDDLGAQGEPPTHPELLDWLATEFIESGWDMKHLVRLMVTSQTYRQSSDVSAIMRENDPYNKQYSRQSRWRLDAEIVRDNALSVSNLLVQQVGGVSVKPYQPAGYWAQMNFPKRTYQHDAGDNQYRRGLYTHWQRTFLHPSLLAFDASAREECSAKRERSNTPLQALVLLNDPTYVEAARVLAQRILLEAGKSDEARFTWAWHQVLSRNPRAEEILLLNQLLQSNKKHYEQTPEDALKVQKIGLAPVSDQVNPVELATWTAVSRALLSLHETITRY
ncbi:MAG: PSD1 domain-containing protein [Planctomycetaceae bacterium]|nr:PSD1 domain-containing protein [Planctomycetaceae bacterium]